MYDTATKAQFIDLRAKGWSYDKISRHCGISKTTLIHWGREFADDIASLKFDYLAASSSACRYARAEAPEACAQESYFHNLEGYPDEGRDATPLASVPRRRRRSSTWQRKFRKFLRSPLVRAAIRYAVFKR